MPSWTLHQGDSLKVLAEIDSDSVDAVITDPPYNSSAGAKVTDTARSKYVSSDAKHTLPDFIGDQRDQRSYCAWLTMILLECQRIARPGASLLCYSDWRQLPSTSDALQAAGWSWRGIIPHYKPNHRPKKNGFSAAAEYVLWGSKGEPHKHNPPLYLKGHLTGSQPSGKKRTHITQKPVEVITELVRICPDGGTVLDPFAGSGTTGVAALALRRSFIGIEATEHYYQAARERLASTTTAIIT